jgi:hypothetical protein
MRAKALELRSNICAMNAFLLDFLVVVPQNVRRVDGHTTCVQFQF